MPGISLMRATTMDSQATSSFTELVNWSLLNKDRDMLIIIISRLNKSGNWGGHQTSSPFLSHPESGMQVISDI